MNPPFHTIDDIAAPTRVVCRVDLNSPVEDGTVSVNRRFPRHAETVAALSDRDHRVVLLAHQGRPGRPDFVTLEQHASLLSDYLDQDVEFCPATHGDEAVTAASALAPGEAVLLENVRMAEAELAERTPAAHATSAYVQSLAELGSVYVGDAYSAAHREHASIVGLPRAMEHTCAGRVMAAEYTANSAIQSREFPGQVVMVLGGTKADDLVRVIDGVREKVDEFLLGGVIGELCLRAQGYDLGYDVDDAALFDGMWSAHEPTIRELLADLGDRIHTPVDLAAGDAAGNRVEVPITESPKTQSYLDIGSETVTEYSKTIQEADAVFVKGALGVFEDERFSDGTVGVLRTIGEHECFSVVGGGDTSRALDLYDIPATGFDHVSIAGGAYVRALAGEPLPGVTALKPREKS